MLLKESCPTCNKEIKNVQSQFTAAGRLHLIYNCGHLHVKTDELSNGKIDTRDFEANPPSKEELYDNLDRWVNEGGLVQGIEYSLPTKYINEVWWAAGEVPEYFCKECQTKHTKHHAFKFQREGVEFVENARLKALIGDAPGTGKTIMGGLTLRRNKKIMTPCLFLVRGATIFQFTNELRKWFSDDFSAVMPIVDRINIMPGFQAYVMSQDLLSRKGVLDLVLRLGIKAVFIDEAQFYKDTDSERCKALYKLITIGKIEYRIPMSGTYIKNRMSEAFTVLNLLDPANIRSPIEFNRRYLIQNEKGVYTRLNPVYEDSFKKMTSKYIIRREIEDVLDDLPELTRDYQLIEITDPYIKKTYNHELGLAESFLKDPKITSTQILGWLARMRSITGMAKVGWAVEWSNEFLSSSNKPLAIGIHHKDVRETLYSVFKSNKLNPLSLSGEDDTYQKARIARDFNEGKNRLLILNMLAGGVGLNLQICSNALVLERQWNSADEEQFEGRFKRQGQKNHIQITYGIAKGTIDEFFHDMVYNKRNILAQAGIGNPDEETNTVGFLKEFAEFVAGKKI